MHSLFCGCASPFILLRNCFCSIGRQIVIFTSFLIEREVKEMEVEMANVYLMIVLAIFIAMFVSNERYWKAEKKAWKEKNERLRNELNDRYHDGYNDGIADASLMEHEGA